MLWLVSVLFCSVVLCFCSTSAQEGGACKTPIQEDGKCMSIYACQVLLNAVTTTDPNVKRFIKDSFCGRTNEGQPMVCCGTKAAYVVLTSKISTDLLPDRQTCGFQEKFRIVGGNNTELEEFPWVVLLKYVDRYNRPSFGCGGALISPRYVITAGHCVTTSKTLKAVRLSEWNMETERDCIGKGSYEYCITPLDVEVESIKLHEDYKFDPHRGVSYDIALLRLKDTVKYTDYIRPICLPTSSERSGEGVKLWVSGWGVTNTTTYAKSPIKQKLQVPVVALPECLAKYRSRGDISLDETQLCAGGEVGKDSCKGDSGGPLMTPIDKDGSQFYLEGIVSFGIGCASDLPGVYTRVSKYLSWIESNVKA